MNTVFVTGIGTDVGKTIAAAIITEALEADYWKPVQAGFDEVTDAEVMRSFISNNKTIIHAETYKLKLAASPHIAAKKDTIKIDLDKIYEEYLKIVNRESSNVNRQQPTVSGERTAANGKRFLIIEGAGGLMVPLNESEFVIDLIKKLNAQVILVSRNYLGSINHSLLTAAVCKHNNLDVLGWIFNDHYMNYEDEIVQWSGYKKLASVAFIKKLNAGNIKKLAALLRPCFANLLF